MPVDYFEDRIELKEGSKISQTGGMILAFLVGLVLFMIRNSGVKIESFGVQGSKVLIIIVGSILMLIGIGGTIAILVSPQYTVIFVQNGYIREHKKTGERVSEIGKTHIMGYNVLTQNSNNKVTGYILKIKLADGSEDTFNLGIYAAGIEQEEKLAQSLSSFMNMYYASS